MKTELDIAQIISEKYHHLSPLDIQLLASIIEYQRLNKGDLLLGEGQVARHISYVDTGLLRQFYFKNGRDITEHFTCEGYVTFCIVSLFKKQPTELMIEALEPTIVYNIPYAQLIKITEHSPSIAQLTRKFLETSLIISQEKADSWRFETARERYNRFVKEYPEAAQRASVNHIASYLLMTPESLSRIRSGTL